MQWTYVGVKFIDVGGQIQKKFPFFASPFPDRQADLSDAELLE